MRLTSGEGRGPYEWQERLPVPYGDWVDGPHTGGHAYNDNSDRTLPTPFPPNGGAIRLVWSETAGEYRFSNG